MTAALDLIHRCQSAGIRLMADGDRLKVDAPKGTLTPDLLADLRAAKPNLLQALAANDTRQDVTAVLSAACAGLIDPERFRLALSPEDIEDIAAGAIPVETLRAYAELFASGRPYLDLPELPARPLQRVTVGPYRIRHADGREWTLYPYPALPLTRQAIEAEAQRRTAGAHGAVVVVEEVKQ